MSFINIAVVMAAGFFALVLLIRKNLQQRETSRKLRQIFIAEAEDLVGKPDFPQRYAEMLVDAADIPQGWLTRFFVFKLVKELFWGRTNRGKEYNLKIEEIPTSLQRKYVLAILALALSDSYRCVIFGRVFRATNSWIGDAVREPKPDVNAHATRDVIQQVAQMQLRKGIGQRELIAT